MTGVVYAISDGHYKFYIGSTLNYKRRRAAHMSDIRAGGHSSQMLYAAIKKYGPDSFSIFVLLEGVPVEHLHEAEQFFIDHLGHYNLKKRVHRRRGKFAGNAV